MKNINHKQPATNTGYAVVHYSNRGVSIASFLVQQNQLVASNSFITSDPGNRGGVSYSGSEIINVHKTKEQREHNKTLFPNPNQNNNGSFVLRHLSPVHESTGFCYVPFVLLFYGH